MGSVRTEKQIVQRIKKLYLKRQPLNISAMKRREPKLLREAFKIRPFLGWRGAIEKAGIEYSDINVELSEFVECRICGAEVKFAVNHVIHGHHYTKEEYVEEFPDAELMSDVSRAKRCRFHQQPILPHWEPFWTPEYIVDRVFALHQMGYPLTTSAMATADGGLGNALVHWKEHLGSWEEIVRGRLGMEPADWRNGEVALPAQPKIAHEFVRYPDGDSVCAEIRLRAEQERSLTSVAIQRGPDSDPSLFSCARRVFGKWENAIAESGIDPKLAEPESYRLYPDKESVKLGIQLRANRKLPLGHWEVAKGSDADGALLISAKDYFGSWDAALEFAGFAPKKIRKWQVRDYTTRKKVIAGIRRRHENNEPLSADGISHWNGADARLYDAGRKLFASWPAALKAAGIDPETVKPPRPRKFQQRFPDAGAIATQILERNEQKKPLHRSGVEIGEDRDPMLLRAAIHFFKSWDAALEAAGLDPGKIRKCPRRNLTPERVIAQIQARFESNLPLNSAAVKEGSNPDSRLLVMGRHHFGSWDQALKTAGLDPGQIRKSRKPRFPAPQPCDQVSG